MIFSISRACFRVFQRDNRACFRDYTAVGTNSTRCFRGKRACFTQRSIHAGGENLTKRRVMLTCNNETVLVTGGAGIKSILNIGYIGSHVSVELLLKGYNVVILDNLSNSYECILQTKV
jgi:hypothetical protein